MNMTMDVDRLTKMPKEAQEAFHIWFKEQPELVGRKIPSMEFLSETSVSFEEYVTDPETGRVKWSDVHKSVEKQKCVAKVNCLPPIDHKYLYER